MSFIPLNGPATNGALSVGSTAVEVKVGASRFDDRKIISIQPLSDDLYYGYSDSVTTSNGTKIYKNQVFIIEATDKLPVWVVSPSASNDVRITEVG